MNWWNENRPKSRMREINHRARSLRCALYICMRSLASTLQFSQFIWAGSSLVQKKTKTKNSFTVLATTSWKIKTIASAPTHTHRTTLSLVTISFSFLFHLIVLINICACNVRVLWLFRILRSIVGQQQQKLKEIGAFFVFYLYVCPPLASLRVFSYEQVMKKNFRSHFRIREEEVEKQI